jgi:hypothetical protein
MNLLKKIFPGTRFLGWENFKWLCKEWLKTFSNEESFFSSKRIERCIFVLSAVGSLLCYIWINRHKLDTGSIILLVTPFFAAAGYSLTKSEKEKTATTDPPQETP